MPNAVHAVLDNYDRWQQDYVFEPKTGEFHHRTWKNPVSGFAPRFQAVVRFKANFVTRDA